MEWSRICERGKYGLASRIRGSSHHSITLRKQYFIAQIPSKEKT